tara:strand:+ start:2200 stop:2514 length:315 start_codon:yes stop_codon:yes gene_type:complete
MLPFIYIGIISFLSSFTISHYTTREILKNNYESDIKYESYIKYESDIKSPNSRSKVRFNNKVLVKYIPNRKSISISSINELWYTSKEYKYFIKFYLKNKNIHKE